MTERPTVTRVVDRVQFRCIVDFDPRDLVEMAVMMVVYTVMCGGLAFIVTRIWK